MASNFHAMGLENGRPCNLQLRRLETPIWCNNHVVFHVDWLPHWPLRRRFGYGFIHVCFILIYWWAWLACRLQAIECRIESNNPPPAFQLLTSTSTTALQKATLQCAPPFARNFDSDSDCDSIRLWVALVSMPMHLRTRKWDVFWTVGFKHLAVLWQTMVSMDSSFTVLKCNVILWVRYTHRGIDWHR